MSRSKKANRDKKRGAMTTAGRRNGQEKRCRGKHCTCGEYWSKKLKRSESRRGYLTEWMRGES